jgi:hypothetical protein
MTSACKQATDDSLLQPLPPTQPHSPPTPIHPLKSPCDFPAPCPQARSPVSTWQPRHPQQLLQLARHAAQCLCLLQVIVQAMVFVVHYALHLPERLGEAHQNVVKSKIELVPTRLNALNSPNTRSSPLPTMSGSSRRPPPMGHQFIINNHHHHDTSSGSSAENSKRTGAAQDDGHYNMDCDNKYASSSSYSLSKDREHGYCPRYYPDAPGLANLSHDYLCSSTHDTRSSAQNASALLRHNRCEFLHTSKFFCNFLSCSFSPRHVRTHSADTNIDNT